MIKIHYTKQGGKWPYKLTVPHVEDTGMKLPGRIITDYMHIDRGGSLYISDGYSWDGPSGPAIDTEDFMRGSLVHDALYQLIRNGHLDKKWRKPADKIMKRICRADGMPWLRAQYAYWAVRVFGGSAIKKG